MHYIELMILYVALKKMTHRKYFIIDIGNILIQIMKMFIA